MVSSQSLRLATRRRGLMQNGFERMLLRGMGHRKGIRRRSRGDNGVESLYQSVSKINDIKVMGCLLVPPD